MTPDLPAILGLTTGGLIGPGHLNRQHGKRTTLFAYLVESDGGRKSAVQGLFNGVGYMRSYNQ